MSVVATATFGDLPQDHEPRCPNCNRKFAEMLTRPWRIYCVRCKRIITSEMFANAKKDQ